MKLKAWKNKITQSSLYQNTVTFLQKQSLPGFKGIPIAQVISYVAKELKKDQIVTRANSMAFSFFIAIFPTIVSLLTLSTYIPVEDVVPFIEKNITSFMPEQSKTLIENIVIGLQNTPRAGILSISFVLSIYFASNGMLAMLRGFEKNYSSFKNRNFLKRRLISVVLLIFLGLFILISASFIIIGEPLFDQLLDWVFLSGFERFIFQLSRWLITIILFYIIIGVIYWFGPPFKKKLGLINPGASLATILSILSSIAFSYYVNQFGNYNKIYGSLGAIIVMLLWLKINSLVILIGYEINASIAVNRDLQTASENES